MINPSVREGWGLVNIEANSVGTPVVGYDVAGIKDSVVDGVNGLLCKFGEAGSLASNAIELVEDKLKYEGMRRKAIFLSKQFTWEKATSKSLKLIESL